MVVWWSPEREALLTKLWEQGRSSAEIAAAMGGLTRNAVLGKVHRMKLAAPAVAKSSRNKVERREPTAPEPKLKTTKELAARIERAARAEANAVVVRETMMVPEPALPTNVSLLELDEDGCRWISGDPMSPDTKYCGARVKPGRPWCPEHHKRAKGSPAPPVLPQKPFHRN